MAAAGPAQRAPSVRPPHAQQVGDAFSELMQSAAARERAEWQCRVHAQEPLYPCCRTQPMSKPAMVGDALATVGRACSRPGLFRVALRQYAPRLRFMATRVIPAAAAMYSMNRSAAEHALCFFLVGVLPELLSLFAVLFARRGFGALPEAAVGAPPAAGGRSVVDQWWLAPADITDPELRLLRFLGSVTWRLPPELRDTVWSMRGAASGPPQLGFSSIRYHLAFTAYAVSCCCMRTPAYTGEVRRVLSAVMDHLLHHSVWGYMSHYWSGHDLHPFDCRENIMWSGHVLHVAALFEALTGDTRYRDGALRATGPDGKVYESSTQDLAAHLALLMNANPSGGVPCEPGLVFVQCNNHQCCAFRLLEAIGADPADDSNREESDFTLERRRWEDFVVSCMRAHIHTGAFKIMTMVRGRRIGPSVPFGLPGADGWALCYYWAWCLDSGVPQWIWDRHTAPLLRTLQLDAEPPPDTDRGSAPPNLCCGGLNLPRSAWVSQLMPCAAQAGYSYAARFKRLKKWVDDNVLRPAPSWLGGDRVAEGPEFCIGSTANYLLGLSMWEGSSLRALTVRPPPRAWFTEGLLLEAVHPAVWQVFRCRRDPGDPWTLHVGLSHPNDELAGAPEAELQLHLRNARSIRQVAGAGSFESERTEGGLLRVTVRLVSLPGTPIGTPARCEAEVSAHRLSP